MRHEDGVKAGHHAYSRVDPEHGVLEYTVARDDRLRHLVLFLARRIDDRLRGTARIALHKIQLNGAEVRRDSV